MGVSTGRNQASLSRSVFLSLALSVYSCVAMFLYNALIQPESPESSDIMTARLTPTTTFFLLPSRNSSIITSRLYHIMAVQADR
jgi:hypothetical protein